MDLDLSPEFDTQTAVGKHIEEFISLFFIACIYVHTCMCVGTYMYMCCCFFLLQIYKYKDVN